MSETSEPGTASPSDTSGINGLYGDPSNLTGADISKVLDVKRSGCRQDHHSPPPAAAPT